MSIQDPTNGNVSSFPEAAAAWQTQLLEACGQAGSAWFSRMQSEVALWTALANKLATTRSPPEALQAYSECVSQQLKMSAEDGQRLFSDCQKVTEKMTKSLGNGWSGRST